MGRKSRREVPASERGRSPSADAGRGRDRGRWSSRRKMEVILRLVKGEDLDTLSRELGVTAARLTEWKERFLAGGQTSLKSRPRDERDEEISRLREKIGEITMDCELLRERARKAEANLPLPPRRSRR